MQVPDIEKAAESLLEELVVEKAGGMKVGPFGSRSQLKSASPGDTEVDDETNSANKKDKEKKSSESDDCVVVVESLSKSNHHEKQGKSL